MKPILKCWVAKPDNLTKYFLVVVPIILSQMIQRLYPIIDNRYFVPLGHEALYIHSIQYNFVMFGQFIGLATYISCLVFWRRKECSNAQGSLLIKHLLLAGLFTFTVSLFCWLFSSSILTYYRINQEYLPIASLYLKIGLCNMVLQAIYGGLDGMLVGSQQQKYSLYIAIILAIGNIFFDQYAISYTFSGAQTVSALRQPMLLIGLSTTVLLITAIAAGFLLVIRRIHGWTAFPMKEMLPVWWGELGSYLIRGIVPFIYAYQLCFANSNARFLVTYQLALHISYIFCFPLIGAMQVAVRDAGSSLDYPSHGNEPPRWWNAFFYTGLIPTTLLLAMGIVAAAPIMRLVYGFELPAEHIQFLALFFAGCWIGQLGNTFTIPLRAAKKSYLVTKNFFIAELTVMLGGTQLLIYLHRATPIALGYVALIYTFVFLIFNLGDIYKLNKIQRLESTYEKMR